MSQFSGKAVLVTGAGGFIGSHLVEALSELNCEVTAMIRYTSRGDLGNLAFLSESSRSRIRIIAGDVEDSHFVSGAIKGKDIVFHLAALIGIPYSYIAPNSYAQTNILGTINVLEAARAWKVSKVVHTSTSECYGSALYTPIDEKHPLQPQSPYSASKIGADMIAESFFRSFDLPVMIVRPFNTYGPRQSARAVIPTIIGQALGSQENISLGAVAPVRDLTFVKDTVSGFICAAEAETIGRVVNLGTGRGISIADLAKVILKIAGVNKPVVYDLERERPAKSEVQKLVADNSCARKIFGWRPRFSLEEGLAETVQFISQHLHLFRTGQYVV